MNNFTTANTPFEILQKFLNMPLESGDEVFSLFAKLPNAIIGKGENALERFVYIPGNRKDRVVLVAHLDTVWDKSYQDTYSTEKKIIFKDGVFKSDNKECGIGADDRAGCAILWALKDCGHSILVVDGEEHGKQGANLIKAQYPKLYKELNRHRFMIEFDWAGTNGCLYNQVNNTKQFKKYIEGKLGFVDSKSKGGTDLGVLCRNICGVNLGIGYHSHHSANEALVLEEWENTLEKVSDFLTHPQPKWRSNFFARYITTFKRIVSKLLRILKIKK